METVASATRLAWLVLAAGLAFARHAPAAGKPVALVGFTTDVRGVESGVMKPGRYVYEKFCDQWPDPDSYGNYSVIYFGEKLAGGAQGKNWISGDARAAAERFIAAGGVVIVGGDYCMRQLMGWPNKKNPDPLRSKIRHIPRLIGRTRANFSKAGKRLGYADDAGNYELTPEGQQLERIVAEYREAFAAVKGIATIPVEGKWEAKPLGSSGSLNPPRTFPKRPKLGKPVERPDGLVLLDGGRKAVIALGDCGGSKAVRRLADELAWHLEKMSGEAFKVVEGEPANGPALVYRTVRCPDGFPRGTEAYFKIWREGDKVILGGEDTGKSRATTYTLEALGCRYVWAGETGKVIPKKSRIVMPEIAVEDATTFVIRKMRLNRQSAWVDRKGNRDFWQWHGMNDMGLVDTERPGHAAGYAWGHYYGDYYPKYYKEHRDWFALQPDGTRTLHLGSHTERPTFCLSNRGLARETAERIKAAFRAKPGMKALSICLPDGATATQCMCEECRRMDPVNAAKGSVTVFFPERRRVPYVASTDRVFEFMNRIAEEVEKEFPDKLLSCYAYGSYTAPPVKTVPHRNLMILSVAGYYASYGSGDEVERNLAAWASFGNKVLWRPNAHAGFGMAAPDNLSRRMFDDISLMAENGIFGVDYDTMSSEWATKPLTYYMTGRAHYNPDRLDYESLVDDWCKAGFGAAWKGARAYFRLVETACDRAARENAASPGAISWRQRLERSCRLAAATDYDKLDRCVAYMKDKAEGDASVLFRVGRLEFAAGLGRRMRKILAGEATEEERADARRFIADYLAKDPSAYPASHDRIAIK